MNKLFGTTVLLLLSTAALAGAQTTTQSVTYEVQAINEISVSGSPSLTVNSATAGSAPTAATANASFAITTNETNKKITVGIDLAMPSGLTLTLNMAAPTAATSAGAVTLGTTAADAVTGITKLNQSAVSMTYTLSATSAAGVVSSSSRTVTFTVAAGA